jgi:hypothetical protein
MSASASCKRRAYEGGGQEEKKQKLEETAATAPSISILAIRNNGDPSFEPPGGGALAPLFPNATHLSDAKWAWSASSRVIDWNVEATRILVPSFKPPKAKHMSKAEWEEACASPKLVALGVKLSRAEDGEIVVEEYQALREALQQGRAGEQVQTINGALAILRVVCIALGMKPSRAVDGTIQEPPDRAAPRDPEAVGAEEQPEDEGDIPVDELPSPTGVSRASSEGSPVPSLSIDRSASEHGDGSSAESGDDQWLALASRCEVVSPGSESDC